MFELLFICLLDRIFSIPRVAVTGLSPDNSTLNGQIISVTCDKSVTKKLTVVLVSFDLVDDMYLQTNCYWSTGQQESILFLTSIVVDFDHFDYPIGPTSFPVVK